MNVASDEIKFSLKLLESQSYLLRYQKRIILAIFENFWPKRYSDATRQFLYESNAENRRFIASIVSKIAYQKFKTFLLKLLKLADACC